MKANEREKPALWRQTGGVAGRQCTDRSHRSGTQISRASAITENGCLRILSRPGYPYPGLTVARVRDIMNELRRAEGHRFWQDSVSLLDASQVELADVVAKNLTDLYLLRLAATRGGRLITFDRTVRWEWVTGCGPADLEVLTF